MTFYRIRTGALKRTGQILRAIIFGAALLATNTSTADDHPALTQIGPDFNHPWGMDFLNATTLLVTERRGALHRLDLITGASQIIQNAPKVYANRQGGLLDVLVGPTDGRIYLCYAKPVEGGAVTAIESAVLNGTTLTDSKTIFTANNPVRSGVHFGCRLAVPTSGPNADYLFASLGERGARENAQNPATHAGSIIRIHLDGRVPEDNPKQSGWQAEIYSIGHRNPQGMAVYTPSGALWTHEHGPRGGDEINVIEAGANYGWPIVSHGKEYIGGRISKHSSLPGYSDPSWVWVPSIAPSGMAFYPDDAKMFPELAGSLLIGSLKFRRLYQVELDAAGLPVSERVLVDPTFKGGGIGRVRDVAIVPAGSPQAGSILLLSDEVQGGVWRLHRKNTQ
ncbi:MAG: PQQ-dependent sugar dehydrogenase [Bacteroidetes bacterium]|nr:PQQ-dependent sugar dehydrogenase [Bacteroidota bacterium]